MLNNKKILFATGGTGGHINPALAVAGYIRDNYPNAEILFVGTADRMEAQLVPAAGYNFRTIEIQGFSREMNLSGLKHNLKTLRLLIKSEGQAKKIIKDFAPDVVIGFGGYVSGPVLSVAADMGIPTAIHEQNAFPGVTNKNLAKKVDRVMLTAKEAEKLFKPKNPCVVTGLPIRSEIINANREFSRAEMGLDERPLILSMGGSLGAKALNESMKYLIGERYKKHDCYYLHATGKAGAAMPEELEKEYGFTLSDEPQIMIREYINDMDRCLSAADLVVCRAGASTLSEIEALGKPSILIPYPYAAENHQYYNAKTLADVDAAVIIEEKDLTGEKLLAEVERLISDPSKLKKMGENAKKTAILDASKRITDCLCEIV